MCLAEVGGKERLEDAVAQLDAVVALTDNVLTVRALDRIGRIHYGQKKYYLALRSFMQIYILYRNYAGEGAQEVAALVTRSRRNAITCCDKLLKSSDTAVKRQVERIKAGLERE